MSLPRYSEYKDSGVEWLGEVPGHWNVMPVKQLASIVNGYPFDSALFDSSDGFPLIRIRDLDKSAAETFYTGEFVDRAAITSDDVLIGMDGDFNVGRWRGAGPALLNQRMCCVRGKSEILTRLLEYSLPVRLKAINDITYATTVKHLASSQVEKLCVTVPPDPEEQTQIAAFLDRETAKIDELVAEQRRLMALLKEKRQAVISHAVTRGLNPDAPLKPSGIEWLGEVPAHWAVRRVKDCFKTSSGGTPNTAQQELYYSDAENGVPWVRTTDLQNDVLRTVEIFITEKALADTACAILPAGTVMVAMYGGDGTVGKNGLLAIPAAINQAVCGLLPTETHNPEFTFRYMQFYRPYWMIGAESSRKDPNISQERVRNAPFPCPPRHEQDAIVSFLNTQLQQFDTLTAEAQRAIDLLQERRTALISAAVTGQIDVRGHVPAEVAV